MFHLDLRTQFITYDGDDILRALWSVRVGS